MVQLILKEPIASVLINLARKLNMDVETLILKLVEKELDPSERIKVYIYLFKKYLKEAEEYKNKGDIVQSSEKLWGAVTSLLNIIGEVKKVPHYTHRDYWEIMNIIVRETNDYELNELLALAEKLHANFYHNFIPSDLFEMYARRINVLIKKLLKYISKLGVRIDAQIN